ncbi:MAG: FtsX-like permease family protein [Cyclobacteriaceae bacterium]
MLKNYFKTAIRNLSRKKAYSLLNIIGLALGIGCSLVIYKVIVFEQSFDKHQNNYERIYRVVNESTNPGGVDKGMGTPHPVGPSIIEDFPEIEAVVRTHYTYGDQMNVKEGDNIKKFLLEDGVVFTENSFFKIFNSEFKAGDKETALTEPNTCVISESEARRLFGFGEGAEVEAMGKTINYGNQKDFKVVGVIADPPEATNFPFRLLFEYAGQDEINPYFGEGKRWGSTSSNTNTYFLANEGFDQADFDEKMIGFVDKYYEEGESKRRKFLSQPMAAIHFDDEYGSYTYSTSKELILALTFIAIFLVLTACINFINLATAQAANRSKEIGIRKAIGGYTRQLVIQFFSEITVISFLAIIMSLAVAEFMFVQLEEIIGTRLQLDILTDLRTVGFLFGLFIVVSFLSGFYPSILLSRMNTVLALKNKITAKSHSGGLNLRKALVVTQFTISQFLIIGTVIISAQMEYFTSKDLGFDKEAIVKTYLPERDVNKTERFKQELLSDPSIVDVTFALSSPTGNSNSHSNFNYAPLESSEDYSASFKCADERYMDVYGLELLAGRNFHKNDSNGYVIINERTAHLMGFGENYEGAVGEVFSSGWNGDKKVIGVMNDFHSRDLSEDLGYVFLMYEPQVFYEIAFKTANNVNVKSSISHFEKTWEMVYPEYVVDWQFFDEELAANYEQEQNVASLMNTFTIVSILIGCLGLYGLISFIAANRTKEVGIRKVLGATVFAIIRKFTIEILILVGIAFAVAAPLAYLILDQWLSNYTFRIDIGFGFFGLAFLATLLVAILTVSHRTISTALINPARTLKDE